MFGTAIAVLSSVATRLHLVGLLVAFGKLKTRRHRGGQIPSPHFTNKSSRGGGVRTHDLLVPNQARYQLRYAPMAGPRSVILGPAKESLPHRRLKSLRQMLEKPLEFVEIGKRDHDSACPLAVGVDHHFHAQCPP